VIRPLLVLRRPLSTAFVLAAFTWGSVAHGQTASAPAPQATATPAPVAAEEERDDSVLNRSQPDFTLINLPTGLRLPKWKSAFRVTHRFTRPLNEGDFGDLASDLFGLDSGAVIGLEFRMGIMSGGQVGFYRTNDRTIQFFGQYDAVRQAASMPFTLDVVASIEGLNNFHKGDLVDEEDNEYATAAGVVLSRTIGDRAAFYFQPSYVFHSNTYSTAGCLEHMEHGHDIPGCADLATAGIQSNTMLMGLSTRVRVTPGVYLVGSWTPRASGFSPGVSLKTFGVEKRLRGHVFQLNVSNSLGTTVAEMARGATNNSDWFLGFNISRRFF
jgi:hypothetical protein